MKKISYFLLLTFYFSFSFAQNNYVFGPSIRVNDDPPGIHFHTTTQRSIACRGDTVYLVWRDDRLGNYLWPNSRIFFSRSTNGGGMWDVNQMISQDDDTLWGYKPHLALDGLGNLYVAYTVVNTNNSKIDIYFVKSTDGGISFTIPIVANDSVEVACQQFCDIAVDSSGQYVYVVWEDRRNGHDGDIYLARSTDGGVSFLPSVRVNDGVDTMEQWSPVVACDETGQYVYVAWMDQRDILYNWDVYFSRSTDYGQTFEANYPINDTTITGNTLQGWPSIYYKDGIIYAVWRDERDGYCLYFAKSTDNGVSFGPNVRVPDDPNAYAIYPSITADDSANVYVAWKDSRSFETYGDEIYFSFSTDGGETFNPNVRVNDHQGIASAWDWNPSVCVNEAGKVFVAWDSDRNDPSHYNPDIYFAVGNYVGIEETRGQGDWGTGRQLQIYPNPFSSKITLKFEILNPNSETNFNLQNSKSQTGLKIYDIAGKLVKSFDRVVDQSPGSIIWNGTDDYGQPVPAGIYFVELVSKGNRCVKKIIKIGGKT